MDAFFRVALPSTDGASRRRLLAVCIQDLYLPERIDGDPIVMLSMRSAQAEGELNMIESRIEGVGVRSCLCPEEFCLNSFRVRIKRDGGSSLSLSGFEQFVPESLSGQYLKIIGFSIDDLDG